MAIATPTKFNEVADMDVITYKQSPCFHVMDCAIRFRDGCPVHQTDAESPMNAYWTVWVQREGPFKTRCANQDISLNTPEKVAELGRMGTTLTIRGSKRDDQAKSAEARQTMLRHVLHLIEDGLL